MTTDQKSNDNPLRHVNEWDDFLYERYSAPVAEKNQEGFRDYSENVRPAVREFYRLNHRHQTVDFVRAKKREYLPLTKRRMGIWQAMEFLNTLVDDSDPDTDLSQIEHLLQTAESVRRDGHPPWFILTGLIHDLGKILCLFGEPQWAVVGDTFPVGCDYSSKIVFAQFFIDNPDYLNPQYRTACGIYTERCGLDEVHLSWGHDEYLYHVVKPYLPEPALYMIRYHSFYAAHREGAYKHLMNGHDEEMFAAVRAFNPYDLYSKSAARPDVAQLRPYYESLIAEYFPSVLSW